MAGIELEEGEAYFPQGGGVGGDDGNIDPDKDFSYIDKKIENVLGQYQKDFMGGLSADVLGARYGGYGSFLPMHQRSPPVLSSQRLPGHISSESPRDPPSEHLRQSQRPVDVANHSLPMKSRPASSDLGLQTGMCSMSNQSKHQSSHEGSSNYEQKKPVVDVEHPAQKPLKVRVKMPSESAFSCGNSSIYSGLGLEMSPCSSLEESSSEYDGTSPDTQDMKPESPTYIVKIMTSFPLHTKEILSPLHHSLVGLSKAENNLQGALLRCAEAIPPEGKSKDRKSKAKHPTKDRKSKQKVSNNESKSKKLSAKPVELVKENREYPADAVPLSSKRREESASSLPKEATQSKASTNAVDACFGETGLSAMTARDNAKGKSVATSSQYAAMTDEGNMKARRAKFQKERTLSFVLRKGSREDQGNNEVGLREEEAQNPLKQQGPTMSRVKNVVLRAGFPTGDGVCGKENGMQKKVLEDQQGGSVPIQTVEEKGKRDPIVEMVKTSKQKPDSKLIPRSQMGLGVPGGNGHPSLSKKKSRKSQINSASSAGLTRGDLMVVSVAAENEEAILGSNVPCKSKRDGDDLQREVRKDGGLSSNVNPGKKGRDLSMKESVMGVSDKEAGALARKHKSSSKSAGGDTSLGSNMGGHLSGTNLVIEKLPGVGDVVPTEMENWVLCEKCEKWRLLPLGMNPDSLPKEWTCSMITWLPGKNSCSISEDETTNGLRALYQGQVVGPLAQNPQPSYPQGTAFVSGSTGVQFTDISGGGRKKNLFKPQMNVSTQSGFQEHIPVKKELQHSAQVKGSKHQKRLARELDTFATPGDHNAPKLEKKVAEFRASGASKKLKREDQQSVENLGLGMSTVENRNDGPGAQGIAHDFDFAKRRSESPFAKAKDETRRRMTSRTPEASQKKRKLKDEEEIVVSTEEHRNEKKLKVSNIQLREDRTSQSQKAAARKSSDKGFGLRVSDNAATTSSSSKISSHKVKAKVKCSPAGSISSSSPLRVVSKSDAMERLPAKQLKFKEETRDRKSNLSRNSGAVSDQGCSVVKISVGGRHLSDAKGGADKPKLKGHNDTSVKLNHVIMTTQQKPAEKASGSINNAAGRSDNFNNGKTHQPTGHLLKAIEASSSIKDVFPWDANAALKEATDRLKVPSLTISGSGLESTEALFEAALKFLHGASLLDPGGSNEVGKCGEMTPTAAYSTTAKLCEHCAHEYERCDNMASAALAYKCMEVAYLRIVYSNDVAASRDRAELDTAVRAAPQVESPSSSASDIDSLNNQAAGEMFKDGNLVLDQRNHVISARNRPNFLRLLNFTQQVNLAMEASRRSQSALEAAEPALTQAGKGDTIPFIKRVLDFSFHDIGGFLHLMKLAMDAFTT